MKRNLGLNELKEFLLKNSSYIKKWILPMVVIFALFTFWVFGGSDEEGIEMIENESGVSTSDTEAITNDLLNGGEEPGTDKDRDLTEQTRIYVDLGGAVAMPGVYEVMTGTRLFQVIEKAGGLLKDADTDHINQAEIVNDGDKIIIGSKDVNSPYYTGGLHEDSLEMIGQDNQNSPTSQSGKSPVVETENGFIVNINLADETQLQLIPGVGPSTARKIVEYRDSNGNFNKIEDIKNISGIGEKTFENMKDFIIV